MKNNEIENHFFLQKYSYDGFIDIRIETKRKELFDEIIDSIIFQLNNYKLEGFPIEKNNDYIKRRIFFKKN